MHRSPDPERSSDLKRYTRYSRRFAQDLLPLAKHLAAKPPLHHLAAAWRRVKGRLSLRRGRFLSLLRTSGRFPSRLRASGQSRCLQHCPRREECSPRHLQALAHHHRYHLSVHPQPDARKRPAPLCYAATKRSVFEERIFASSTVGLSIQQKMPAASRQLSGSVKSGHLFWLLRVKCC